MDNQKDENLQDSKHINLDETVAATNKLNDSYSSSQSNLSNNIKNEKIEQNLQNDLPKQDKVEDIVEDSLEQKLENEKQLSNQYLDRLQRTMAEFDNFRKRTTLEKSQMYENGVSSVIEKLLPVYDNFERAIAATSEQDKNSNVYKGLEMIYKQFNELFLSLEIQELEGVGHPFDPNIHNAVVHIQDENLEENIICEVMQKGFKYKNKLIRPSMVKVAN